MRRHVLVIAGAIVLNGCASPSTLQPERPAAVLAVSGLFEGSLEIEGDRVASTLQVQQRGSTLTSRLAAPDFGMTADGGGELSGRAVELIMSYGADCPGTARLLGRIAPGPMRYVGRFLASDCTGEVEGSFSFTRAQTR